MGRSENLGFVANNKKQVIRAVKNIKNDYNKFQEELRNFSENFVLNGAETTAKIVGETLDKT